MPKNYFLTGIIWPVKTYFPGSGGPLGQSQLVCFYSCNLTPSNGSFSCSSSSMKIILLFKPLLIPGWKSRNGKFENLLHTFLFSHYEKTINYKIFRLHKRFNLINWSIYSMSNLGFYSYLGTNWRLLNLKSCKMRNKDNIKPEVSY